jgi:hypothetical protein
MAIRDDSSEDIVLFTEDWTPALPQNVKSFTDFPPELEDTDSVGSIVWDEHDSNHGDPLDVDDPASEHGSDSDFEEVYEWTELTAYHRPPQASQTSSLPVSSSARSQRAFQASSTLHPRKGVVRTVPNPALENPLFLSKWASPSVSVPVELGSQQFTEPHSDLTADSTPVQAPAPATRTPGGLHRIHNLHHVPIQTPDVATSSEDLLLSPRLASALALVAAQTQSPSSSENYPTQPCQTSASTQTLAIGPSTNRDNVMIQSHYATIPAAPMLAQPPTSPRENPIFQSRYAMLGASTSKPSALFEDPILQSRYAIPVTQDLPTPSSRIPQSSDSANGSATQLSPKRPQKDLTVSSLEFFFLICV